MAKLSYKEKHALPTKEFALPGERYPIPDEAHGRNALARGSQAVKSGHLTKSELATIVRKVKAKFPGIEISSDLLRLARRG
jgi:hypothetical protein